ncbi:MAG: hypothetical protein HY033_06495 [Ignavibacteriae bacterium]|nr:hypothetical protein [Ignavibacteria bacterium]MBI3364540.1 hypothetical protein [Ignavibacteriota bacterium]
MMHFGQTLSTIVEQSERLKEVYKTSLHPGDCLVVKTCNSVYTIRALEDGSFTASGGWFDRKGKSPMKVRINGCTWGGSAIKINIAAAAGLCLEFGNRVRTSPIRHIVIFPNGSIN